MGFFFKIVVQFGDHRIPIQMRYSKDRRTCGAKLRHLMGKIKEVVKNETNEEIDFRTHDFEKKLFGEEDIHLIKKLDEEIEFKSMVFIKLKRHLKSGIKPTVETIDKKVNKSDNQMKPEKPEEEGLDGLDVKEVQKLLKCENTIKQFRTIVVFINIGWNLKNRSENWNKVSQKSKKGFRKQGLKILDGKSCSLLFYNWAHYYAKNYDKFDGKLIPEYQRIFDLLKVVHTLDLDRIYGRNNETKNQLIEISKTEEIQKYFNENLKDLWTEKLQTKEELEEEVKTEDKTNDKSSSSVKQLKRSNEEMADNSLKSKKKQKKL